MAVSTNLEPDLDEALDRFAKIDVDVVYLVDSHYFFSEQIHYLADKYHERLPGRNWYSLPRQPAAGVREYHRRHH